MITLIEALNFRCLRYVRQPLAPFHVLVGPNASGKTTFLDAVAFLGRVVSSGPEVAVAERTSNPYDLTWNRAQAQFELAIEARIPDEQKTRINGPYDRLRYEIVCGIDKRTQEFGILAENVHLRASADEARRRLLNFRWFGAASEGHQEQGPAELRARFDTLVQQWLEETAHLSSITEIVQHPAYQAIIAMGPAVIPLILADLEREPKHWGPALYALTGARPVPAEHAGRMKLMATAWLRWARENGYVW